MGFHWREGKMKNEDNDCYGNHSQENLFDFFEQYIQYEPPSEIFIAVPAQLKLTRNILLCNFACNHSPFLLLYYKGHRETYATF